MCVVLQVLSRSVVLQVLGHMCVVLQVLGLLQVQVLGQVPGLGLGRGLLCSSLFTHPLFTHPPGKYNPSGARKK